MQVTPSSHATLVAEMVEEPSTESSGAVALHVVLLFSSAALLLLAWSLDVRGKTQVTLPLLGQPLPELCYWRNMTGMDCPGCGLTRCFISLAHGQVRDAWQFNPVGILLFAGLVFQFPYRAAQVIRLRRGLPELQIPALPAIMCGACILLFVQWICRVVL